MTLLKSLSRSESGRGVALRAKTKLSRLMVATSIGQSPGPGTGATVFLSTNHDAAYNGAIITWIVKMRGHAAQFATSVIPPISVAQQAGLEFTVSGCAAEFWEVQLTLTNGLVPAVQLESAISAFGVENIEQGETLVGTGPYLSETVGPGASGSLLFLPPLGTDTYLLVGTARVTHAGGVGEAVGDSYVQSVVTSWENRAGVISVVPPVTSFPTTSSDGSMATMSFGPSAVVGGFASVPFTVPAGLDAGTLVQVTIQLLPIGMG